MKNKFNNWEQIASNFWKNNATNWIVQEISTDEKNRWVVIDDQGMMISCESKDNKEDCMEEADYIVSQEKKYGRFLID